jgi:hypothetical protein
LFWITTFSSLIITGVIKESKKRRKIVYHAISFVLDGVDEAAKLFEGTGNDDFIVRLAVADAFELETH